MNTIPLDYFASKLSRFVPWTDPQTGHNPQLDFLRAAGTHRVRMYRGGNQTGKTTIGMVDKLLMCLGWHPFCRFKPPVHGWCSALDWEWGVGQVLWPKMKEWIPWNLVRAVRWYRKSEPELPATIVFKNGSQLDFKSSEAGRGKYQGTPLHFVHVDEEHPADIIEECRARLLKHGGYLDASLTPVRRERWVLDLEREHGTVVVRASGFGAARAGILDMRAVQEYADSLPDRQREVRIEGGFAQLEGLVYPSWSRDVHCVKPRGNELVDKDGNAIAPWPLPASWPRYAGIDFGYGNPTAVIVCGQNPATGEVIVYGCLYAPGIRISKWGDILGGALPPLHAPMVADWDAMERAELQAVGIPTTIAQKDVIPGLESVERWLQPNRQTNVPPMRFVVDEEKQPRHPDTGRCDAYWPAWEIEGYRYPEPPSKDGKPSPKDLPIKRDDHAMDALRYVAMLLDRIGRYAGPPSLQASSAQAKPSEPRARDNVEKLDTTIKHTDANDPWMGARPNDPGGWSGGA